MCLNNKQFLSNISKLVESHLKNKLYKHLPIEGTLFELFVREASLQSGFSVDGFAPSSLKQGADMVVNDLRISCKAGQLRYNTFRFSSHRLQAYKNIDETINFLRTRQQDTYLFMAKIQKRQKTVGCGTIGYQLFQLPESFFDWNKAIVFQKDEKNIGIKGECFTAIIRSTQSQQLWITINKEYIKPLQTWYFSNKI